MILTAYYSSPTRPVGEVLTVGTATRSMNDIPPFRELGCDGRAAREREPPFPATIWFINMRDKTHLVHISDTSKIYHGIYQEQKNVPGIH